VRAQTCDIIPNFENKFCPNYTTLRSPIYACTCVRQMCVAGASVTGSRRRANVCQHVSPDLVRVCICVTRCTGCTLLYSLPALSFLPTQSGLHRVRIHTNRERSSVASMRVYMCKYETNVSHVAGFISRRTISEIFMWLAWHAIVRGNI
jgi:hypothetical protein